MKKVLLFLSAALLSLSLSAQEFYEVTISSFDFVMGGDNNVEIQDQLGGAMLKSGDMIYLMFDGYFDTDVVGVNVITVVDNAGTTKYTAEDEAEDASHKEGTPNYWIQLSAWNPEVVGGETTTAAKTHFYGETIITLNADAASAEKIIVRCSPRTEAEGVSTIKMRPTADFAEGTTYSVDMPTVTKFDADDPASPTNYKAEFSFETDADLAVDDIVKITVDGKFSQDVSGLNFMIFDNDGNEVLGWSNRPFEATKDEACTPTSFEFTVTKAFVGTNYKFAVFVEGYDAEKPLSFLKTGDVEHEAVELAVKEYTNVTLALNEWESGSNYQYVEEITSETGFFAGDYVTFSISGNASDAIEGLQVYLMKDDYTAVSAYVPVANGLTPGDIVNYSGVVELSSATEVCKLVIVTTDAKKEGVESIKIAKEQGGEETAVEDVNASAFAVQNGVVYSAGEIVVYNVAGAIVATANQVFNVASLNEGVYFIVAQEGTIKYVK